jgi:4-amino-4-deoxy-L-arabinose transferase-like glycosyltransferase
MGKVGKGLGYYSDIGRKTKGMARYSTFPFVPLSVCVSLSHTRTHTQHKSAFCVFLLSLFMLLGWRNSLSLALCMFCVCSLGSFMLRSIAVFFLHTDGPLLFSLPLLLIKI